MSMPQRCSSAATLRASSRSGVTRAAAAPGVSSLRRSRSAIVTASSCAPAQSYRLIPARVSTGCAGSRRHASVVIAGRKASAISRTRRATVSSLSRSANSRAPRETVANRGRSERPSKPRAGMESGGLGGQSRTSAGVKSSAFSNPAIKCCGWASSSSIADHSAASRSRSRPGRITAPWSSVATSESNSVIAGMPPISPAAITGWRGGERRQAAVCRSSRRLRRDAASRASSSARIRGQWCGRISRNWWTIRQCSARPSGTKSAIFAKLAPSVATRSRSRPRLAPSAAACPGKSGPAPRRSPQCRTSRVSSNRRRSSGIGGGTARSSSPPSDNNSSSEARSPIGRIRGSSSGVPAAFPSGTTRRNASRSERTARRVGSRTVMRGSSSGSAPAIPSSPAASVARNGRCAAIV